MQEGMTEEDFELLRFALKQELYFLCKLRRGIFIFLHRTTEKEKYVLTFSLRFWLLSLCIAIRWGKKAFETCSNRGVAETLRTFVLQFCKPQDYEKGSL